MGSIVVLTAVAWTHVWRRLRSSRGCWPGFVDSCLVFMKNPPDTLSRHNRHGPEVRRRRASGACAAFLCGTQDNGAQRRIAAAPTEWGRDPWGPQAAAAARGNWRARPRGADWTGSQNGGVRSEERRVGKEGRSRWSPYHLKKK